MTIEEFARDVAAMRRYQKKYFASRHSADLNIARDWERRVDADLKQILEPPALGLFDQEKPTC